MAQGGAQVLLPPSVLPFAKNVSYHTLETFPERNYGFVDLPVMDAEKVRRKLNGTIFRGTKVRVEEARPQGRFFNAAVGDDVATTNAGAHNSEGHPKRQRRGEGVIAGIELPSGRKVRRGWTKPMSSVLSSGTKKQKLQTQTSSYTTTSECLFRTTLPSRVLSSNAPPLVASTKARMGERKMKDMTGRETVVHEFSSTTKFSSFLRGNTVPESGKVVFEFVDGTGWVDDEGNVIEAIKEIQKSAKRERNALGGFQATNSSLVAEMGSNAEGQEHDLESDESDDYDDSDSSGDESICSSLESERDIEETGNSRDKELELQTGHLPPKMLTPIRPSPASADSSPSRTITIPTATPLAVSSVSVPNLSLQIPTNPPRKELHPLEAVFKHPSTIDTSIIKSSVEPATPFTFFGPDGEDPERTPSSTLQTPFSWKDTFQRGIRSAAPTPDTAAPWKRTPILWPNGINMEKDEVMQDEDGNSYEVNSTPLQGRAGLAGISEGGGCAAAVTGPNVGDWDALPILSDPSLLASLAKDKKVEEKGFEELFYESRGEMSRTWKRRRREMGKEKRKRENKRRERRTL